MKNVMNLTPEEKFNQEVWWILQEIKKEQLSTPKGEKVEFSVRLSSKQSKKTDNSLPSAGTQIKLLHKLKEWKALDLEPTGMYFDDPFSEPTAYLLTILKKFDELYRLYESGGFYSENQKTTTELDSSQSIIKQKSLELIAREIGDLDSGSNLVEFLTNCGVKRELIEYPNTKWRMIYSVLLTLASLQNKDDRRTLFKIIEGACHPLMYGGDKNLAKETADKFNSFLEYDNFFIENGLLWKMVEDPSGIPTYYDKDGNTIETPVYMILPKKIDKLYLYWNELIKLTKFYFANKDNQSDEINSIYFEIIKNIEETLNSGCGNLKNIYKKPFRNIIGCEFETQRQGLTVDSLFVNLYDFLGEITECSLPEKNNIEKIKKDNSIFLAKIKQYKEQHLARKEIIQEPPATKIEITKIPELKIKKSEKLSESNKKANKIDYQTLFNEDKSVLSICDKSVKIRKFSNQYHILRIIFKDNEAKNKDWQLSEIAELIDSEKLFEWKLFYNTANEIKKKIAIETGIKDFFITTTQSIKINEKYLKKS